MPVLGDVAHAVFRALADRRVRHVLAAQVNRACRLLFKPRQRVDKLRLTVSFDAREADDLAPADLQADILDGVVLVELRRDRQPLHVQHNLAGLRVLFVDLEVDLPADHHGRKLLHRRLGGVDRADALALAKDCAAVCNRHNLCQLVRDEKDGFAFRSEILHDLHQLVDLLRRENCRRLVEDQDFIVAVEHFENFGSLLHADGNILDLRVRIDAQTVALRQGDDLLARLLLLQEARLVRLHAENDIVQHREALDQLEVLVNHADVEVVGVVGVADFDNLSVLFNDAALRLIEPEEHAHQRRLAGTVFAEQRVDFPSLELEGDVVIGADAGKFLRDIQHLNDIFRFRQILHSFVCRKSPLRQASCRLRRKSLRRG